MPRQGDELMRVLFIGEDECDKESILNVLPTHNAMLCTSVPVFGYLCSILRLSSRHARHGLVKAPASAASDLSNGTIIKPRTTGQDATDVAKKKIAGLSGQADRELSGADTVGAVELE